MQLLKYFIAVKVDKEERPDIDSIYMNVCQTMTGSGGWPLSVFITPEQKPFFAGTYFPRQAFQSLLKQIHLLWQTRRDELISSGTEIEKLSAAEPNETGNPSQALLNQALEQLSHSFDKQYCGFGNTPKFPIPHNLIFLLDYYSKTNEKTALNMAEHTLMQMYKGGIFDHIGYGFSRYSTDRYYLVPHFEKMLYDNALLIMSYVIAYSVTGNTQYKDIAKKQLSIYCAKLRTSAEDFFRHRTRTARVKKENIMYSATMKYRT